MAADGNLVKSIFWVIIVGSSKYKNNVDLFFDGFIL
tara:strand:- start:988 stop:1095 length:108 start_codon:yes stop_codon:yes gene_type:complete